MLGLELCGFPFRRGVFELVWDLDRTPPPPPPPAKLLDAAWQRLGFRPREEEACSLSTDRWGWFIEFIDGGFR